MNRHIVGVKFLYQEDEYQAINGVEPKVPIAYCQAVKAATAGNMSLVGKLLVVQVLPGALGFAPPTETYYTENPA